MTLPASTRISARLKSARNATPFSRECCGCSSAHKTSLRADGNRGFRAFVDEFIVSESTKYPNCPPKEHNANDISQHWYPQHCRCVGIN